MANPVGGEGTPINWSFPAKQPHLPPKSPLFLGATPTVQDNSNSFFSNWSNFPYPAGGRKQHQRTPSASFLPQTPPSWIDDLLNDTPDVPVKKSSHRRSSSDSVAFLDTPTSFSKIDEIAEEDEFVSKNVASMPLRDSQDFDKLDEEQLMSMFADIEPFQNQQAHSEVASQATSGVDKKSALENPSTPSDHNSVNEHSFEEKGAGGLGSFQGEPEVESGHQTNLQQAVKGEPMSTPIDSSLDPKRAKRILANRQSAQRSRVRKLQYISELERSVNALQAEVSALSPQVAYLDHQRVVLNVDNSALKQRIAALAQEKLFKDAHYDALKKEVQRLRQLYQQQQQQHQQLQLQQDISYDLQQKHFSRLDLGKGGLKLEAADKPSVVSEEIDSSASATKSPHNQRSRMLKPVGGSSSNLAADNSKGLESGSREANASISSDYLV